MGIVVEILFLAVLCDERVLLLVLDGRHIYLRYNATSCDIVDNTTEQLDLKTWLAVGILMYRRTRDMI